VTTVPAPRRLLDVKRCQWVAAGLLGAVVGFLGAVSGAEPHGPQKPTAPAETAKPAPELSRYEAREFHMGQPIILVLYAADDEAAQAASRVVFDRFAELDRTFSDYKEESELSRLCRDYRVGEPVSISSDLFQVLKESQRVSEATDGLFDVTLAPVIRLWRQARRTRKLPDAEILRQALARVGSEKMRLDERNSTVTFSEPGMQLDLGGIGVGWTLDDVGRRLKDRGIHQFLIDASGDILCGDPPPGRSGWRVAVQPLLEDGSQPVLLSLRNRSVTTSGDAYRFVEIDGKRYSHIVDPKTGMGLTGRASVTLVASKAVDADAFSKGVSVLGVERGLKFVESMPGFECSFVVVVDGMPRRVVSRGFPELEEHATATPVSQ